MNNPKLSNDFLKWIKKQNLLNKSIVEIGSGYSTLFFSKYFKYVYSFESDIGWFFKINSLLEKNKIKNVKLSMFDKDTIMHPNFLKVVSNADFFLIDNNPDYIPRSIFAQIIHNHKKDESIIVLDNGVWNIDAYKFLKEKYYCIDFPYEREDGTKTETSAFFKKIETKNKYKII